MPKKSDDRLEDLFQAAKSHGEGNCDVEYQIGDLEAMLRSCFAVMFDNQKVQVLEEHEQNLEADLPEE